MIKSLKERMKNKKGFTLVELIVVIVIILVLAAVMVPSLLKYVERARMANVKADAATLLSQIQADYVASQASGETGISVKFEETAGVVIDGVTVNKTGDIKTEPGDGHAIFSVDGKTATGSSSLSSTTYDEIVGFAYRKGNYFAVWTTKDGWQVTKTYPTFS